MNLEVSSLIKMEIRLVPVSGIHESTGRSCTWLLWKCASTDLIGWFYEPLNRALLRFRGFVGGNMSKNHSNPFYKTSTPLCRWTALSSPALSSNCFPASDLMLLRKENGTVSYVL